MTEQELLSAIGNAGGSMTYCQAADLALKLGVDPKGVRSFLQGQIASGRLDGDLHSTGSVHLTDAGWIYLVELRDRELEQLQQLADQRSQLVADKRSDRRFQIQNTLLGTLLGFLLGLITEHFTDILGFISAMIG